MRRLTDKSLQEQSRSLQHPAIQKLSVYLLNIPLVRTNLPGQSWQRSDPSVQPSEIRPRGPTIGYSTPWSNHRISDPSVQPSEIGNNYRGAVSFRRETVTMLTVLVSLHLLFVVQLPFLVHGRSYYTARCNDTLYDETKHMCCGEKLFVVIDNVACCGTKTHRTTLTMCCKGDIILSKFAGMTCEQLLN
ncbi:hypothetical protein LSAT2_032600 [Lamellibrachia satsuma]|nr:hypothetical protein LSAT2_032600 [Lamellibrachia satsuma]